MSASKSKENQRKLRSAEKFSSPSNASSPAATASSKLWDKIESRLNSLTKTLTESIVSELKAELNYLSETLTLRINNMETDFITKIKTLENTLNDRHERLSLRINNTELNIDAKIKALENTFNERTISFNQSLFTIANRVDTLERQESRLDTHEEELTLVKAQMLEKDNTILKIQIDSLARNNISGDLVLHGIPIFANENLESIFQRFCTVIDYSSPPPIHIIRTKPKNKSTTSAIIVKLPHAQNKVNVLTNATTFYKQHSRAVSLNDLGFEGNKFVRVYESLTKNNHAIFRKANEFRRKGILHSVFTRRGRVYVRQTNEENKKPICITGMNSFEVFCSMANNNTSTTVTVGSDDVVVASAAVGSADVVVASAAAVGGHEFVAVTAGSSVLDGVADAVPVSIDAVAD